MAGEGLAVSSVTIGENGELKENNKETTEMEEELGTSGEPVIKKPETIIKKGKETPGLLKLQDIINTIGGKINIFVSRVSAEGMIRCGRMEMNTETDTLEDFYDRVMRLHGSGEYQFNCPLLKDGQPWREMLSNPNYPERTMSSKPAIEKEPVKIVDNSQDKVLNYLQRLENRFDGIESRIDDIEFKKVEDEPIIKTPITLSPDDPVAIRLANVEAENLRLKKEKEDREKEEKHKQELQAVVNTLTEKFEQKLANVIPMNNPPVKEIDTFDKMLGAFKVIADINRPLNVPQQPFNIKDIFTYLPMIKEFMNAINGSGSTANTLDMLSKYGLLGNRGEESEDIPNREDSWGGIARGIVNKLGNKIVEGMSPEAVSGLAQFLTSPQGSPVNPNPSQPNSQQSLPAPKRELSKEEMEGLVAVNTLKQAIDIMKLETGDGTKTIEGLNKIVDELQPTSGKRLLNNYGDFSRAMLMVDNTISEEAMKSMFTTLRPYYGYQDSLPKHRKPKTQSKTKKPANAKKTDAPGKTDAVAKGDKKENTDTDTGKPEKPVKTSKKQDIKKTNKPEKTDENLDKK